MTPLVGVPEADDGLVVPDCEPPSSPTDDCVGNSELVPLNPVAPVEFLSVAPATQETEIATAASTANGTTYFATIEASWGSDGINQCVIDKKIRVYRIEQSMTPQEIPAGPNNDLLSDPFIDNAYVWYTDPSLAVARESGAVFLSVLKFSPVDDTASPNLTCIGDRLPVGSDYDNEVQVWVLAPGATQFEQVAFDDGAMPPASAITAGLNEANGGTSIDHPRIAAYTDSSSIGSTDRAVVTWTTDPGPGGDGAATIECSYGAGTPQCEIDEIMDPDGMGSTTVFSPSFTSANSLFCQPAFGPDPDPSGSPNGDLFIACVLPSNPPVSSATLTVRHFEWLDGLDFPGEDFNWEPTPDTGTPDSDAGGTFVEAPRFVEFAGGPQITADRTPALAVARIGDAQVPSVFLAWTIYETIGDGEVEMGVAVSYANASDLTKWREPVNVPQDGGRGNDWAPTIVVAGEDGRNILDIVHYHAPAQAMPEPEPILQFVDPISTRLTRYRAHDLTFVGQYDLSTDNAGAQIISDLPFRAPGSSRLWPGEYAGVAHVYDDVVTSAVVGFPWQQDVGNDISKTDGAVTSVVSTCSKG